MKRFLYNCLLISMLIACCLPTSVRAADLGLQGGSSAVAEQAESIPQTVDQTPADSEPVQQFDLLQLPVTQQLDEQPAVTRSGVMISYIQTTGATGAAGDEVIELYNNSDETVDVTGWCVKRVSSGEGKTVTNVGCINPADISQRILLPAKNPILFAASIVADVTFTAGMSDAGGAVVVFDANGVQIDAIAWGNNSNYAEGGIAASVPTAGKALRRIVLGGGLLQDADHNNSDVQLVVTRTVFEHGFLVEVTDMCRNIDGNQSDVPHGFGRDSKGNCTELPPVNECQDVVLSEIGANLNEQFIEIHNTSDETVDVSGCQLMTNRAATTYVFDNLNLQPDEYRAFSPDDMGLKLTKATTGVVYLLSSDGMLEVDKAEYKNLVAGTSWSLVDDAWVQTYAVTSGASNHYEKYPACDEGYVRNDETGRCNKIIITTIVPCNDNQYRSEETGRCRNVVVASTLTPCKDGQYRSEETNRCRSIALAVSSTLKPCADDQFRNPATGRCKKIASSDDVILADCGEGRERNPDTNRCRNVAAKSVPNAAFKVEPVAQSATAFIGWWALGGVGLVALGYGVWEWRQEMLTGIRKIGSFISSRK